MSDDHSVIEPGDAVDTAIHTNEEPISRMFEPVVRALTPRWSDVKPLGMPWWFIALCAYAIWDDGRGKR